MEQNEQRQWKPSPIQILSAVAKVTNMTIGDLMGASRQERVIIARAAFYKLATDRGYSKSEIMFYLDKNRTVGYNYEANVNGHLKRNRDFKAICVDAAIEVEQYPHRVEETQDNENSPEITSEKKAVTSPAIQEPVFEDHDTGLGWKFTAEEMRRMWYACREASRWFSKHYLRHKPQAKNEELQHHEPPTEMNTMEASIYLDVGTTMLTRGVKLGYLHRFKKPGTTGFWYKTSELDNFRPFILESRKGNIK